MFLAWFRKYDPNQPRAPAGSADGGQWTAGEGGASSEGRGGRRFKSSMDFQASLREADWFEHTAPNRHGAEAVAEYQQQASGYINEYLRSVDGFDPRENGVLWQGAAEEYKMLHDGDEESDPDGGEGPDEEEAIQERAMAIVEHQIEDIDHAIQGFKLKHDVIVYRGADKLALEPPEARSEGDALVGNEFSDAGFVSTSASIEAAMSFVHKPEDVLMEIRLPAGMHAMPVNAMTDATLASEIGAEAEVLLPRDTQFKVVGYELRRLESGHSKYVYLVDVTEAGGVSFEKVQEPAPLFERAGIALKGTRDDNKFVWKAGNLKFKARP